MKRRILSIICIAAVLMSCLCFTACSHEVTENGLTFMSIGDYASSIHKKTADVVQYCILDDADGYACRIEADAPADVVIPDEYDGKPVTLVAMTGEEGTYPFKSVTFGKNVKAIYNCMAVKQSFPQLTKIVLPDSLKSIRHSLNWLENVEVTVPASIEKIEYSFIALKNVTVRLEKEIAEDDYMTISSENNFQPYSERNPENVKIIIQDESGAAVIAKRITDHTVIEFDKLKGIEIGTEEALAYSDAVDADALCVRAKEFFGAELDETKKVDPDYAGRHVSLPVGPIVVTSDCCEDQFSYSADSPAELVSTAIMQMNYPDADLMRGESAPAVYCIAERTKGASHSYGDAGGFGVFSVYEMRYRISLRRIEDDELICWYEVDTGYAPDSKSIRSTATLEDIKKSLGYQTGAFYCLYDESRHIPRPEDCVCPYLFG